MSQCGYDSETGQIIHAGDCQLAKFLAENLNVDSAIVGHVTTILFKGERGTRYLTPPGMLKLIRHFEQTEELTSGRFKLLVPPENFDELNAQRRNAQRRLYEKYRTRRHWR